MKKMFRSILMIFLISVILFSPLSDSAGRDITRAKNVIILIGDGMGPGQFWAAQLYSSRILKKDLKIFGAMNSGHTAFVINDTADATVTESAAAAGQIATGQRMVALTISTAADGKTPVRTILEMAKEKKMATGLVTTSGITDATPAAFSAHVPARSDEEGIAEQQIKSGIDILFGGRKQYFLPKDKGGKRKDGRDLLAEAKKAGYSVVETADQMMSDSAGVKLLGLFNMSNLSYSLDRASTEPTLAQMTEKALQVLSKNENGFFAMIEGGRIDHASHRNDIAAAIHELLAFDEAAAVALKFASENPDTLVLITADHETGGLAMIGCGKEGKEYVGMNFEAIQKITASYDRILDMFKKDTSSVGIKSAVKKYMSIELTDEEAQTVSNDTIKKIDPNNFTYDYSHSLSFVLRPYLRAGWAGQTHTGAPLFLIGFGPGSEAVKGILHNTEIFTIMKNALDLK